MGSDRFAVQSREAGAPGHLGHERAWLAVTLRAICLTLLVACAGTLVISVTLMPVPPESPGLMLLLASLILLCGCLYLVSSEQVLAERNRELERSLAEKERAQEVEAELQARMRRAEKLEALGQLAGGVAHDFNNLLMVIQGNAQMLEYGVRNEEDRLSVDQIREATRQAAWLTGQLLTFSRKGATGKRVIDLDAMVLEAIAMLERLVPEHVVIETLFDANRPHVEIAPGQVQQILMNLVANARDAMPEGGTIVLSTALAAKPGDAAEKGVGGQGRVVLTVRDEGHGMDAATLDRIFDPYFTTKPSGEGTGLGLASVFAIVDGLGGRIEVDSAPGLGSSFHIELPVSARTPAADARSPALPSAKVERLLGGARSTPVG